MNSPFAILCRLALGCLLNALALGLLVAWLCGHGGLSGPIIIGIIGTTVLPATDDVERILDAMRKASEP